VINLSFLKVVAPGSASLFLFSKFEIFEYFYFYAAAHWPSPLCLSG